MIVLLLDSSQHKRIYATLNCMSVVYWLFQTIYVVRENLTLEFIKHVS